MYPVSTEYQNKIKENNRLFECKIQIEHSQGTLYLDDKDLVAGSLTYTESSQTGEEFTVGGTVASDTSFTILNKPEYENIEFIGATVFINIGLLIETEYDSENYFLQGNYPSEFKTEGSERWEWVPLGRFNIDIADRQRSTIQIKAIDNMINLDKPYSLSKLSYPATLPQIFIDACNACDVPFSAYDILNMVNKDYIVRERPSNDLTFRDVIGYVAELAGCFAKCNRNGELELKWYTPTDIILDPNNRFNFKPSDDVIQIKGVMATVEDKTYLTGTDDYAIDLTENPLLQGDYETVLPNILANVENTIFTPYTSEWQGNPAIQAGDIIKQIDRDGKKYDTLVTKSIYKYRGRSILEARGLPEISRGYKGSTNRKIAEIKRKIDVEVGNKLTTLEEQILQSTELIANMLGGYAFYEADAFYVADHPDLTQAIRVWKWGIGGFGYSENGVDGPYTTAVTAEGSIVAELVAAGIITADMVQTGILQSEDGSTWISLDDGSFNLKNKIKFIDDEFSISLTDEDLEDTGIYIHHIVLSNENQSFVTDSTGKVTSETIVTTDIDTFKGTTRVASTIGTPILKSSSGATINYGTITKTNPTTISSGNVIWRIPTNTNINSDSGWIEIPITIDDKHYVKKLYWSKAKSGNDGSDGENARLVDIIPSNVYFIKDLNGTTPDEITLTPEFQNTSYQKWEYSTNGTTWTSITRTTSSTIYPWMNSTTRVLTIPKGWSVLNNNDYVVFRVTTTTGEIDVQTISILYDVSEVESRLSTAENKITPTAIMNTVQQEVSKGGTTIAQKSDITQTMDEWVAKFDYLKAPVPFRYVRSSLQEYNNLSGWYEIEVFVNGLNIALNKPVTSNRAASSNFPLNNYTDGSKNSITLFESIPAGGWTWLQVDLGKIYTNADNIIDYTVFSEGDIYNYKLEISEDGTNWHTIFDGTRNTPTNSFALSGFQQGITTINADGVKVEHSGSNECSMIKADGFVRKYANGEATYLNGIYTKESIMEPSSIWDSTPIAAERINLPSYFKNRYDDVEIFIIPILFQVLVKMSSQDTPDLNTIEVKVQSYDFNTSTPYLDIIGQQIIRTTTDDYWYNPIKFLLVIIGR